MPSKSAKQERFMRAVAHSPEFAKKVGVPQKVGKEYEAADKRMSSHAEGGQVMMNRMGMMGRVAPTGGPAQARLAKGGKADKAGRALVKKSADTMGRAMMKKGGKCYAGGGLVSGHKSADGIAKKGKTKGKMC